MSRDNSGLGDHQTPLGHKRSSRCFTLFGTRPGDPQLHQVEEKEKEEEEEELGGTMGPGRALHARGMKTLLPWTARASRRP